MNALARLILCTSFLTLGVMSWAAPAAAQKIGKDYFEDSRHGYRFKYPKKWRAVPPQEQEIAGGLVMSMNGDPVNVRSGSSKSIDVGVELRIYRLDNRAKRAETGPDASGGLRGRVKAEKGREDVADLISSRYSQLRDYEKDNPATDEVVQTKYFKAHHRTWGAFTGDYDVTLDTWTFSLVDYDICLFWLVPTEKDSKYLKVFEQVAKTFEETEITASMKFDEDGSYEDWLAYHAEKVITGWRVLPTPSERYIIKTSVDDDKFLKKLIDHLERSRDLYEVDFPPDEPITDVSVVIVCKTSEEFQRYGNVGRGVGGFFKPSTAELVLYDGKNVDRNATYAVMAHEGFHQYCHFLFKESEAHRWFDEGHGDYYGGGKVKGRRMEITPKMPAGFGRLMHAQELVRQGTFAPIEEHINFNHQKWQGQGPSNVSSYCQSWSIIYMLRQGMLGNVHKKVWKEEYASIIPNYVSTLFTEFQTKYDSIRAERKKEWEGSDKTPPDDYLDVNREDLSEEEKLAIWKKAMDASWGQIDIPEFEENWKLYVKKHLK